MWRVTIKGILAHKIRFLLTGVAVILGVSFIAGTLVLTATISKTFDGLFANIYANTDAVVRAEANFKGAFNAGRGRIDASLLPVVRKTSGVAQADGAVQGFAQVIDKKGDALNASGQGAPALGFSYIADRDLSSFHLDSGRAPRAPDQIVIDQKTADKTKYKLGASVPVITKEGRANYELVGTAKFGTANSLLGATAVIFTPTTASRVLGEPGKFDQILVKSDPGVSQEQVVRNVKRSLAGQSGIEVLTGEQITRESQNDFKDQLSFFNTFLLIFGVIALLVGSFIIFNTFSIIVAQRSARDGPVAGDRCQGRSGRAVGALRGRAGRCRRVGDRVRRGCAPRGRAQGRARGLRSRHPRERDHDPGERADLVVRRGARRHDRGCGRTRDPRVADPADRGAAANRDRSVGRVLEARRRRSAGHRARRQPHGSQPVRRRRADPARARNADRVPRRGGARPDLRPAARARCSGGRSTGSEVSPVTWPRRTPSGTRSARRRRPPR